MKKYITLLLFFLPFISSAQLIAGHAPSRTSIVSPGYLMSVNTAYETDSVQLDLDCDGLQDVEVAIYSGNPWWDIPATLCLAKINPKFSFCWADSATSVPASFVQWYSYNDTMSCGTGYSWKRNPSYFTSFFNYNYFDIAHQKVIPFVPFRAPDSLTEGFLAFRKKEVGAAEQLGWINISFNFRNPWNPIASIHSFTQLCWPTDVDEISKTEFRVYPTLFNENITLVSKNERYRILILNHSGQTVYKQDFDKQGLQELELSHLPKGMYFLSYQSVDAQELIKIQKF